MARKRTVVRPKMRTAEERTLLVGKLEERCALSEGEAEWKNFGVERRVPFDERRNEDRSNDLHRLVEPSEHRELGEGGTWDGNILRRSTCRQSVVGRTLGGETIGGKGDNGTCKKDMSTG
jgi:hypothetical protein